jgi:SAM-dependent methyltransferase
VTIRPEEKAALLKRYSDRLARHGPTLAALGWTKPKHTLRYRILLEYWLADANSRPVHVLDFGCGFGDLYGYASSRKLPINYIGVDINPDLIRVARERYPSARFLNIDLFAQAFDERFDVVLSSGVHNFMLANNREFNVECFKLFDRLSSHGFAANFMSNRVDFCRADIYYASPEDILSLAFQHSRRVSLRHDYMPFEFTIFVDKRGEIDPDLLVFQRFAQDCGV